MRSDRIEADYLIETPVSRAHRCTLENLAVLEPTMSEAAFDFMMGHLNIELSIVFRVFPGKFSDGAIQAIDESKPMLLKEGWLDRIFNPEAVKALTHAICYPKGSA
jgi:hypothetical protein